MQNDTDDGTLAFELVALHALSTYEVVFWCIMYGTIAFLSVFGNSVIIYIILWRWGLNSVTNYFILNLSVGDLITGLLAIPFKFQAALFQEWYFPNFVCQLVPFIETVSLSISVFTLTGSAADRFRAVLFPDHSKMTLGVARLIVIFIWVFSIVGSYPYGIFHEVIELTLPDFSLTIRQCQPIYGDESWWKAYNIYLTIIQYFVPLIIVDGAYAVIAHKVWAAPPLVDLKSDPRAQQFEAAKRRVVKLLIIVVVVFTFCWLPLEVYLVLNELQPQINEWYYINVLYFCFHWLAMSNSCLNPIIYGIYNEKFQKEYKRLYFRLVYCGKYEGKGQPTDGDEMAIRSEATYDENTENAAQSNMMQSSLKVRRATSAHDYIASELGQD
uniref:G-protein coupled receptors family 1 profile domain-containing protein n=1 Tax=Plectus sambesii TaxID=2011161 RepID=A0A914X598_9BILA